MICFINLRLTVGVPAAACQKHTLIMKANVVHSGELIVGYSLFKGPEEIVSRGHQQRGILDRIFFIPPQQRVRIFLRNAVEALYKCFQLGRDRPEQQWRGKDNAVCLFDFRDKLIEAVFLNTELAIPTGVAAKAAVHLKSVQGDDLHFMPGLHSALCKGVHQLPCISLRASTALNNQYFFHKDFSVRDQP